MRSPFKFLDAYTVADRDIFFGREKEIETLYNMVFKTPLVMVYGLSGTGKTSLVQCGLSTRFDGPDWLPFLIRKEDNINESIRKTLKGALSEKDHSEDLNVLIERLFYKYFRPVYLLFDQFEELFILGEEEEQQKFMQDIQRLQDADLPCRVVLILREEYIGQLYDFEKIIPSLFDYKVRVEPMSNKYIREVMSESFKAFNISLEPPEEDRYQQILNKLSSGKSNIPLPYLQVYLDMLYKNDYKLTYPNGSPEALPPLTFTKAEIEEFGEIDDVLQRFLDEKTKEIQEELQKIDASIPPETVRNILDVFVTDEGTKRPIHYTRDEENILHVEPAVADELPAIPASTLSICLLSLEEARLLRFRDDSIELAHDTLAALIDEQRTDEQRRINEMRREIKSSFGVHQQTGDFLTLGQLELYVPYLKELNLDEGQKQFINRSEIHHQEEGKRKEEELRQEKLLRNKAETNEQKASQRTKLAGLIAAFATVAGIVAVMFFFNAKASKEIADERLSDFVKEKKAKEAVEAQQLLAKAQTYMAAKEYWYAHENLVAALELDPDNTQIRSELDNTSRILEKQTK